MSSNGGVYVYSDQFRESIEKKSPKHLKHLAEMNTYVLGD